MTFKRASIPNFSHHSSLHETGLVINTSIKIKPVKLLSEKCIDLLEAAIHRLFRSDYMKCNIEEFLPNSQIIKNSNHITHIHFYKKKKGFSKLKIIKIV